VTARSPRLAREACERRIADLEAKFADEDRQDRRRERARRRAGLADSDRDVGTFDGFAATASDARTPRS